MIARPETAYRLDHEEPWLVARFPGARKVLSWTLNHPGFVSTAAVAWLEIADRDLPPGEDPLRLLNRRLADAGLDDAPAMLTSRSLAAYQRAAHRCEDVTADCTITLGLSNAERVGRRRARRSPPPAGTINLLCHLSLPMSDAALLEALSVATQARTTAVLAGGYDPDGGRAAVTGTGTDCIALACPIGGDPLPYAGLHTAAGEALGAAVLEATERAMARWLTERRPS